MWLDGAAIANTIQGLACQITQPHYISVDIMFDIDRDISVNIIFSQRDISVNIKNYIDRDIMRLRDLAATPWIVLAIAAPSSHIYFYFCHSGPMRRQQQEQNLYK